MHVATTITGIPPGSVIVTSFAVEDGQCGGSGGTTSMTTLPIFWPVSTYR